MFFNYPEKFLMLHCISIESLHSDKTLSILQGSGKNCIAVWQSDAECTLLAKCCEDWMMDECEIKKICVTQDGQFLLVLDSMV